jgi:hypothetical protein
MYCFIRPTGFQIPAYSFISTKLKLNTSKNNIFLSIPHHSVSRSFLSSSVSLSSILSPFRLRSVFRCIRSTCLTFLAAHPAPSQLSFRPIPILSLLVFASESRHHFPFFRALSPHVHRNSLCLASHAHYCIWIL